MSTSSPRCHLCLGLKVPRTNGLLICEHCDQECPATKQRRDCDQCQQGNKSEGRGPRTGTSS